MKNSIENEKGIALITAIMLLMILTIIGLAAVNTMQTERNIASGETAYRLGFYKADSGVSWAVMLQEDDIEGLKKGDLIKVPENSPFKLIFQESWIDTKTGDRRCRFISKTVQDENCGIVEIEGEIRFATAQKGRELDMGNQTNY